MGIRFEQYDDVGNEVEPIFLPSKMEVCGGCGGKGQSSAYLGAFTEDQIAEDPEFFEDYMASRYDRVCGECNGLRVVEVLDWARLTPEQRAMVEKRAREEAYDARLTIMERRMGA